MRAVWREADAVVHVAVFCLEEKSGMDKNVEHLAVE